MSIACKGPERTTIKPRSVGQICVPALSSAAPTEPRCSRCAPKISRWPPVIAPRLAECTRALNQYPVRASALDPRTHRREADGEVIHLGIARRVEDFRFALREAGRHDCGLAGADGRR